MDGILLLPIAFLCPKENCLDIYKSWNGVMLADQLLAHNEKSGSPASGLSGVSTLGRCAMGLALLLFVGVNPAMGGPHKSKPTQKKLVRNLPEISASEKGTLGIWQETNFFSTGGIGNLTLDYGWLSGWDIGLGLYNAQLYTGQNYDPPFEPDLLASLEKHWPFLNGQVIVGAQMGPGFVAQDTVFMDYSYLEYQKTLSRWNTDVDVGGYYGNAAFAGINALGWHVNLEIPVIWKFRLNGDYLSGQTNMSATTVKILYPLTADWRLGFGVQLPNINSGDHYIGILGFYWH